MFELTKRLLGLTSPPGASHNFDHKTDIASAPDPKMLGLYDAVLSGWFQEAANELFTGMPITIEDTVLDAGCGEGNFLAFCARRGAHVMAVDVHEETLEVARKLLTKSNARRVDAYCSRADEIPVADGVASRIICTEVLEHVEDPNSVVRELFRVGKPGALYLFSVPGEAHEGIMKEIAPSSYFEHPNHIRIFSSDGFRNTLTRNGLTIVSQDAFGFYWSVWWSLYWGCLPDLSDPHHPALDHWSMAWEALLQSDRGRHIKTKLDNFLPKSQVILARKPNIHPTIQKP